MFTTTNVKNLKRYKNGFYIEIVIFYFVTISKNFLYFITFVLKRFFRRSTVKFLVLIYFYWTLFVI